MKRIFLLLILSFTYVSMGTVAGQSTFQNTYGGPGDDDAGFILQTADSGYIVAGTYFDSMGGNAQDAYVFKAGQTGNVIWSKTYGDTTDEVATCIQNTSDGNYIVCGYQYTNTGQERGFILKITSTGDTIWTKIFGPNNNRFNTIRQTSSGDFIAGGIYQTGVQAPFLVMVDSNGTVQWAKSYGSQVTQGILFSIDDILVNYDGNFAFSGNSSCSGCPLYLIKVNNAGDTLWTKYYTPYTISGGFVETELDHRFVIGGRYQSGNPSYDGGLIIMTSETGDIWLFRKYFMGNNARIKCVWRQASNNSYYCILEKNTHETYLLHVYQTFSIHWCMQYLTSDIHDFKRIQRTYDGGLASLCISSSNSDDLFILKTNASGSSNCDGVPYSLSASIISPNVQAISTHCPVNSLTVTSGSFSPLIIKTIITYEDSLCNTILAAPVINSLKEGISVFPNPTMEILNVRIHNSDPSVAFRIFNARGDLIASISINQELTAIELADWSSGLYFYQAISANGLFRSCGKFVKE